MGGCGRRQIGCWPNHSVQTNPAMRAAKRDSRVGASRSSLPTLAEARAAGTSAHLLRALKQARRLPEPIHIPGPRQAGKYRGLDAKTGRIPRRCIRAYCRAVAREFQPQKIVLFGSYAYGTPTEHSDVDLMVIMPHRGRAVDQVVKIRNRIPSPFAMDLLVRTPEFIAERLGERDMFIELVMSRGKVMYESQHA